MLPSLGKGRFVYSKYGLPPTHRAPEGRHVKTNKNLSIQDYAFTEPRRGELSLEKRSPNHFRTPARGALSIASEVHPFEDGNGRIARVMMNAELVNRDKCKIIIPAVYREEYLLTPKKIDKSKGCCPLC